MIKVISKSCWMRGVIKRFEVVNTIVKKNFEQKLLSRVFVGNKSCKKNFWRKVLGISCEENCEQKQWTKSANRILEHYQFDQELWAKVMNKNYIQNLWTIDLGHNFWTKICTKVWTKVWTLSATEVLNKSCEQILEQELWTTVLH